jgi:hypothetical protein
LIDAKSAKNIRNKQVSFKVFDESNSLNEFQEGDDSIDTKIEIDPFSTELNEDLGHKDFQYLMNKEMRNPNTSLRPYYVGKEVLYLHKSEEYLVRYPIKYGDFNVSDTYPL